MKSFRRLRPLDVLLISGGGQLTESWGGAWGFPFAILRWVLLARLAGVRPIVLNIGAGPLTQPLAKYFVRTALALSCYASFRDERSAALALQIGFTGTARVFPDVAYSLAIPGPETCRNGTGRHPVVGIAPMPYGSSSLYVDSTPGSYERYLRRLVSLGKWLVAHQYQVTLFCTDSGVDPPAVDDLDKSLRAALGPAAAGHLSVISASSTRELLPAMLSMDYVITCRFHGVILAHLLNIPVLALSHHSKVDTVMSDLGLSQYCLDIRQTDAGHLIDVFRAVVENRVKIRERMAATLASHQSALAGQFDALFSPACSHAGAADC